MDAHTLLTTVAPLGVTGLSIVNVDDPETWTFQGDYDRAAVLVAIQGVLSAAPASSQFWAAPLTPVEKDVAALKRQITGA